MSIPKKRAIKSRDAPGAAERRDAAASAWLCSTPAFQVLVGNGYTRLADVPEVRMCVDVYAELISSMTIHLIQNTALGDVRVKNGLSRKLDVEPYSLMTRKNWVAHIVRTMMLEGDGNQVTYPRYTPDGLLGDLVPLSPTRVSFVDMQDGGYGVRYGGNVLSHDEILHFAVNPDPERPYVGTGYRVLLKDVVRGIKQAGGTKQAILESPTPSLVVKVDGLTEEFASTEGRRKLGEQYMADSEQGRPWFIPAEAFDVTTVTPINLKDLALAENLTLDKRTAAAIFGVPPFLVGVGEYKQDEYNQFVATRILSKAKVIEQELTRKLLYAPDLYWRFNPRSLYAYSLKEIVEAGREMVDRMAMRRNEWRDWLGFSPDPDMVELLALENYIPADKLGDQKKLKGAGGETD